MSGKRKKSGQQITTELVVGMVFLVSMVILAFFTIVLTKDAGFWGKKKTTVIVDISEVGGVSKGDKVLLRGLQIGKIAEVMVSPDDPSKIRLVASVDPEYGVFGEGYLAEIRSSSVLGGLHLYLESGDRSKPVSMPLQGKSPVDVFAEAGRMMEEVHAAVGDLRQYTKLLGNEDSTLYKLAATDELHSKAVEAMDSLQEVGKAAKEIKEVRADINKVLTSANDTIAGAGKDVSTAANKVTDAGESVRKAADSLTAAIDEARKGKGTVGMLMNDEEMAKDLKSAISDIRTAVSSLTGEKSSVGKMMRDDGALYDSIKGAFDDVGETFSGANEVVEKVKKGEGTLGKLVMDETLYNDLRQTIRDVQGAVNDFREQAPILTFGSFIFGSL